MCTYSPLSSKETPPPPARHRPRLPPSLRRRCFPQPLVPPDSPFQPSAGQKGKPEVCIGIYRDFPTSTGEVGRSLIDIDRHPCCREILCSSPLKLCSSLVEAPEGVRFLAKFEMKIDEGSENTDPTRDSNQGIYRWRGEEGRHL